jgi:ribose transport system ATP-binding protein
MSTAVRTGPLLAVSGVSKTFGGQAALSAVSLEVDAGEVHAVVGMNGSGKSTLIKILSGFHQPDPSPELSLRLDGEEVGFRETGWRERIHVIHQDLALVPTLSVMDNLAIGAGYVTGRGGRIRWQAERAHARQRLLEMELDVDPNAPVSSLSRAEATMVAMIRALDGWEEARGILILDEPTAALSPPEAEEVFAAVRRVASGGAGVLFVSHRLDEVFNLAARVSVLRNGFLVGTRRVAEISTSDLVQMMVGDHIPDLYRSPPRARDRVLLAVEDLGGAGLRSLSFELREGEILGIAGLRGSGREAVAPGLIGNLDGAEGLLRIGGEAVRLPTTPDKMLSHGIALVPANRLQAGGVPKLPMRENITLPALRPLVRRGTINRRREREDVKEWMAKVNLVPEMPERPFELFSGGNQQKGVIAKVLRTEPSVVILDEPTQGVDVAAKASIHALLASTAATGTGVLVCSSEADELAHLCARVLVLRDGELAAELSGEALSERSIVDASVGQAVAAPAGGSLDD